jgi:hypothetical protein
VRNKSIQWEWEEACTLKISRATIDGNVELEIRKIELRNFLLSLGKDEMLVIEKG